VVDEIIRKKKVSIVFPHPQPTDKQNIPKIPHFIYNFGRILAEKIEIYSIFIW